MKSRQPIIRLLPAALLPVFYALLISAGAGAVVSPRGGGQLPDGFRAAREKDRGAFTLRRAWIGRASAARAAAMAIGAEGAGPRIALTGTMRIPVIGARYADYSADPGVLADLGQELFDGPWPTGTMAQYFDESSDGLFTVTGDLYGWVDLDDVEDYYTGTYGQGVTPGLSETDVMIWEAVGEIDPSVDFGQYDNDGPDGIPNSGDDDGYVDVLIIVHPTYGAECNNSLKMWSHSWLYSLWDGIEGGALETNDPAAGGGVILVDDYIVAPTVSCESGLIEIGVFCHEMGHAIGLPDLYDGFGSYGIGYWGLMGSGNWNTPDRPAHPCGWSKELLGWVDVIDITWEPLQYQLLPVIQSDEVLRLVTPTRRFKRRLPPAHPYGWGMVCGYTSLEAYGRQWPDGEGYGNSWDENISRTFYFDGTGPVTLEYLVETDLELDYDFAYALIYSSGPAVPETLAVYTGVNALAVESVDLTAYLSSPGQYTVSFALVTDFNYSDEDGLYDSQPARAFLVDNVRVTGGGEDYSCDFDIDAGGWRETSEPAEYFLVENRTRIGFDANLPGEGLLIWHAEPSTARSELGNSGGSTNTQARGLVLEEADGNYDLLSIAGNAGDSGDPWQGSSGNRNFHTTTWPSSHDNGGQATPVSITNINSGSALFRAGMPAPFITSVDPAVIDKNDADTVHLDIRGSWILEGAECSISILGQTVDSDSVEWLGENRILARFQVTGLYSGQWDVEVTSGDGQRAVLESGLTVNSTIIAADVETGLSYIKPVWRVSPTEGLEGCLLYRSEDGGLFIQMGDTLRNGDGVFEYTDDTVVPGIVYRYGVKVVYESVEEEFFFSGEYSIGTHGFHVVSQYPNPFTESTRIVFFTPERMRVRLRFYDVAGRLVDSLGDSEYDRGTHTVFWAPEPARVASGIYFCTVETSAGSTVLKTVLVR